MKKALFLLAISGVTLFGCDKEDDDQTEESQKTTLLVQQAWKFDNAGIDIDRNGTIETPLPAGTIQTCLADNTVTFAANGSGTVDEGPTKCATTAPQTSPFTWSFLTNETILNINGSVIAGTSGGQFKIVNLSSTQLSLSKDTAIFGQSVALVANLKH